jgi:hypothetical protein
MSEVWSKVYKSDNAFFGQETGNLALLNSNHMRRMLNLLILKRTNKGLSGVPSRPKGIEEEETGYDYYRRFNV